ncbi:hypothetical protein F441_06454 [Phytophthora nicotianae CJ01A1]|uniref:Uncharacterized protein n=1 Tax=Phytophthora nicotianae CJ01A1 TaxID=1317063 RepID=W2XB87_PHYNI|nr:hypothetical protein F441_06454 [Phytophthora nicotianae CJ01A1]
MTPASQIKTLSMPRGPKNKNKEKYKGALAAHSAVEAAALFRATRGTIYRWRKDTTKLKEAAAKASNKFFAPSSPGKKSYIRHPELEQRYHFINFQIHICG